MNKHSLLGMISACTVALILSNAAQAASFTIDDFNVDTGSSIFDGTTADGSQSAISGINGANIVMNVTGGGGWTRTLIADLSQGDRMDTTVCIGSFCGMGHVSMSGGSSNGTGTFEYNGPAIDMSSYTLLGFDWGADLLGASVDIIFSDSNTTSTVASWSSLAATGGPLVSQTPMGIAWGTVDSSAITQIQFVVNGVENLDSSIDNFTAVVPVPAAAWLFGSALLGLAGVKRRKA